jgi:hypothetical protein
MPTLLRNIPAYLHTLFVNRPFLLLQKVGLISKRELTSSPRSYKIGFRKFGSKFTQALCQAESLRIQKMNSLQNELVNGQPLLLSIKVK